MDAAAVRKCLGKLLTRMEPGLLVPKEPWSPELQRDIGRIDPGKNQPAQAVKSGLLLWNDDLNGCHTIAQELPDEIGGYLHGIMHRREPDYPNAKYWFRKVGRHPLFPQMRVASLELLGDAGGLDSYRKALQAGENWDPFRMVDWCESAGEEREIAFLRALQAIEIQGLTYYWLEQAGIPRP
jgi:hypothetical protein